MSVLGFTSGREYPYTNKMKCEIYVARYLMLKVGKINSNLVNIHVTR